MSPLDFEAMVLEGYVPCLCGEWVVGMHIMCKKLISEERYDEWVLSAARVANRRMGT